MGARLRWRRFVPLFIAAMATFGLAAQVLARAGGGQDYSGGGGGHGGGGGGDDLGGLIYLLIQLIRLAFHYPAVGVPLLILVITVVVLAQRGATGAYQKGVIRRSAPLLDLRERERALGPLREIDPRFEIEQFVARVTTAFEKTQWAWSRQDLQSVRSFISDAVHERFSLQFDEQRALGYRNEISNVRVDDVRVVQVLAERVFMSLSVRIAATARDRKVRLSDGAMIEGSDRSGPFVEIWSFLRRRGTQTDRGKPGLIEGRCPNCGAAIEMNQNADCAHCGAFLRSGEYDWVLAEITHEYEWAGTTRTDVPSVLALMERDEQFNLQELEDRASVVFWRLAAAQRLARVDPLRKVASPEYIEHFGTELRQRAAAGAEYRYEGERAVGSVDTLGISSADGWDRALVEIRWSGAAFERIDQSIHQIGPATPARTVLELSRRDDVRSDASRSISSAHCPRCGAPETGDSERATSSACAFCGEILNDGSRTWTLTAVRTPAEARDLLARDRSAQAAAVLPESDQRPVTIPSSAAMLAWMVQAAQADGSADARETEMIARFAERHGIPRARVDALVAAARNGGIDIPMPLGEREARQWMSAMVSAALADGNLTRQELALLSRTGMRVGMNAIDVQHLVKQRRREMYLVGKAALRDRRIGAIDAAGPL